MAKSTKPEPTLEELIEKTRPHFKNKTMVAFLGESGCGKTVVSALLKHALSKHFIPKSKGKWEAVPSSGYEYINSVIAKMKKGNYPDQTLEKDHPQLIIDVYNMDGTSKIELILRDMSGENYTNLLSTEHSNFEQQMSNLLTSPEKNAHLIFAKMYVVMIDCSQKNFWDTDPANITSMISKIKKFKQKIHHFDDDKKFDNPIAIVFTKADRLVGKDNVKSAEELMKDYPGLESSLTINHNGPKAFFKVGVNSRKETKKEAVNRVKEKEEEIKKKFELHMKAINTSMETAIDQAVSDAEKTAREANQNPDQINAAMDAAKNKVLEQYKTQLDQEPPILINKEEKLKQQWLVEVPLNYSDSEYNSLISWILEKLSDK